MTVDHKLTIQLTSMSSFICGENEYTIVNENKNDVTFEAVVSSPGLKTVRVQKITMLTSEWENAKQIYSEWLKEQAQ